MPIDMNDMVAVVRAGRSLDRAQMRDAFELIMTGQVEPGPMGDFLRGLSEKGETVDEIAGAADVMNEKVTRVRCDVACIDTCGTGGDGISTFNVSTTAAVIAAAAGATVAKHGNRTHTRASGSAEAIAALGVNIDAPVGTLERCLRDCGIAFLYAPNLHPAMRHAGPVRKRLGIRTIFNFLGPLTNPAGAKRQVLGVARREWTRMIAEVLAARDAVHAWVVNGETRVSGSPGLCDLTITGPTNVTEVKGGRLRSFTVRPEDFGFESAPLDALIVDSPEASAAAVRAILDRTDQGPRRRHALLNAGAALVVAGLADELSAGVILAAEALDSGQARHTLDALAAASQM